MTQHVLAQERDSLHFKTSPLKEEIMDDVSDQRKNTLNDLYDFQEVSENTSNDSLLFSKK